MVAALFWAPAARHTRGFFPTPLDDVYIHFDFARSLARGHGMQWVEGNGYSSGETSPLYAVLLALGWLVGFRDRWLGVWAAIVAVVAVSSFVQSLASLIGAKAPPRARWLNYGFAFLPLSVGLLDWSLFSGMEVAAFAAALGRTLVALARACSLPHASSREGYTRQQAQWILGAWGLALVWLRPEAIALSATFAVVAACAAAERSALAAFARSVSGAACATAVTMGANALFTGETQSAGAVVKLLTSMPYLSDVDRVRAYVENIVAFGMQAIVPELAWCTFLAITLSSLIVVSVVFPAHRSIGAACCAGAVAWVLLVSLNNNCRFHHFRYQAPAVLLVMTSASLGAASLSRAVGPFVAQTLLAPVVFLCAGHLGSRVGANAAHFRRASANIASQHIETAARLTRIVKPHESILLGDAGVIAYLTHRKAIDAVGLGGYHAMPFARAHVSGEASTLELLERLPSSERPQYFAMYPHWFPTMTTSFGREIDRVTITDNVICGAPTKVIYEANWNALEPWPERSRPNPDWVDTIDIADVISEREHAYRSAWPNGGQSVVGILKTEKKESRFDGGRTVDRGGRESFRIRRSASKPRVRIVVRTDKPVNGLRVYYPRGSTELKSASSAPGQTGQAGQWVELSAEIETPGAGETLTLEATQEPFRNYHIWIVR